MDQTIIAKQLKIVSEHYPNMNITQLGMVCIMIGAIRASLGHEHGIGTVETYIHPKYLSKDVRRCLDFLQREVLALKRSKIDIDYWKRGNKGSFRRDRDTKYMPVQAIRRS